MNWQTQHHQGILNGVNGYFPKSRIAIQHRLDRMPGLKSLAAVKH